MVGSKIGWVSDVILRVDDELMTCRDNNLTFVEAPALAPPEVHLSQDAINQIESDLKSAQDAPLPDEDDDL